MKRGKKERISSHKVSHLVFQLPWKLTRGIGVERLFPSPFDLYLQANQRETLEPQVILTNGKNCLCNNEIVSKEKSIFNLCFPLSLYPCFQAGYFHHPGSSTGWPWLMPDASVSYPSGTRASNTLTAIEVISEEHRSQFGSAEDFHRERKWYTHHSSTTSWPRISLLALLFPPDSVIQGMNLPW